MDLKMKSGVGALDKLFQRMRQSFFYSLLYWFRFPVMAFAISLQYGQCAMTKGAWKLFYLMLISEAWMPYTTPERFYRTIAKDHKEVTAIAKDRIAFVNSLLKTVQINRRR